MNIFVVHNDPCVAAQHLCDKHVVKMIVETAQILCTVARTHGHADAPYRSTHSKHPCTLWAAQSTRNWDWLLAHGFGLLDEYSYRYDKVHKTTKVMEWAKGSVVALPSVPMTPFVQAMPNKYKHPDPVEAYRQYYIGEKSHFARWHRARPAPDWYLHTYLIDDHEGAKQQ